MKIEMYTEFEPAFDVALGKVNAKAKRLSLQPIEVAMERKELEDGWVTTVTLPDTLPTFSGWFPLGVLDFVGGEVLTRALPGRELAGQYTNDATRCDHCGVKHSRVSAVVIQHINGTIKQVGKSCLKDFLGTSSLDLFLSNWLVDFIEEMNSTSIDEGFYSSGNGLIPLRQYLLCVTDEIKTNGWLSRGKAREINQMATADAALSELISRRKKVVCKGMGVDTVIEWAKTQGGNEYLDNLASIANLDFIPYKYIGYAASMISAYQRAMEREEARRLESVTASPAPTGKVTVIGTILALKEIYSEWGMVEKITLQTIDGWKLWVTLPKAINAAKVGDKIQMTVTVTPSDNDTLFAFGKRPSKASIIN